MYSSQIKVKPMTFHQENTKNIHKSHQTTSPPVKRSYKRREKTQSPNHILFQIEEIAKDSIEYKTITTSSKIIDNLPELPKISLNTCSLLNIESTSSTSSTQHSTFLSFERRIQPSTSSNYPIETFINHPTTSSSSTSSLPISSTNQPIAQSTTNDRFSIKNMKKVEINESENDEISLISIGDSTVQSSESIQSIEDEFLEELLDDLQTKEE